MLIFPGDIADKIERFLRGEEDTDWRDLLSEDDISTILVALRNNEARLLLPSTETIPLAYHDEIGLKVSTQPWDIQAAIILITAHCLALKDEHPTGTVADLAGCISQNCLKLADALSAFTPALCTPTENKGE